MILLYDISATATPHYVKDVSNDKLQSSCKPSLYSVLVIFAFIWESSFLEAQNSCENVIQDIGHVNIKYLAMLHFYPVAKYYSI